MEGCCQNYMEIGVGEELSTVLVPPCSLLLPQVLTLVHSRPLAAQGSYDFLHLLSLPVPRKNEPSSAGKL